MLGYACINMELREQGVFTNRTLRKATLEEKGYEYLSELVIENLNDMLTVLKHNENNGIRFFRISSEIFPFISHPELGYDIEDLPNAPIVIQLLKDRDYDILDEDPDYKYLREMRLSMVEEENYNKLMAEKENKAKELEVLKNTTIEQIWLRELNELEKAIAKYRNDRKVRQFGLGAKIKKKTSKKGKKSKK